MSLDSTNTFPKLVYAMGGFPKSLGLATEHVPWARVDTDPGSYVAGPDLEYTELGLATFMSLEHARQMS